MTIQADLLKAFGDFREDVGALTAKVDGAIEDIAELKSAAQRERERAEQADTERARQEIAAVNAQREGRRKVVLALIGGSFSIMVAVIGAAALILTTHG